MLKNILIQVNNEETFLAKTLKFIILENLEFKMYSKLKNLV